MVYSGRSVSKKFDSRWREIKKEILDERERVRDRERVERKRNERKMTVNKSEMRERKRGETSERELRERLIIVSSN